MGLKREAAERRFIPQSTRAASFKRVLGRQPRQELRRLPHTKGGSHGEKKRSKEAVATMRRTGSVANIASFSSNEPGGRTQRIALKLRRAGERVVTQYPARTASLFVIRVW